MDQTISSILNSSIQSQPEPMVFHSDINNTYQQTWKKLLKEVQSVHKISIKFLMNLSETFNTISKLCVHLNLCPDVEFSAFDSLEHMLDSFLFDLTKAIDNEPTDKETKSFYWNQVCDTIKVDSPLIILLTLSLAAKYNNAKTMLDTKKISELMETCTEEKYTSADITKHEFNLFKTMGFSVARPNTLHSMEHLLKLIYDPKEVQVDVREFLMVGVTVLRYTYLKKNDIYAALEKLIPDPSTFKKFANDKILLAAAVVLTSKLLFTEN